MQTFCDIVAKLFYCKEGYFDTLWIKYIKFECKSEIVFKLMSACMILN